MKDLKIFTNNIEESAKIQIDTLLEQEQFKDAKVRIMPDVHSGAGCVIGFTADLGDKVIPNVVGVDIGCGVLVIELGKIDLDLKLVDKVINENIPSGFNTYDSPVQTFNISNLKCFSVLRNIDRINNSLGTLGGGNHFIEIDRDEEDNKYLIIHSGSRNLGKQVAEIYQQKAITSCKTIPQNKKRELIDSLKAQNRNTQISIAIKELTNLYSESIKLPNELCYLDGQDRLDYLHDMKICQEWAVENRKNIAIRILQALNLVATGTFESVHNYIDFKRNIVRKGAISAELGQQVIIPINMRDGCILGVGKGNADWNYSAPHGSGRLMSRTKAKEQIKLADFEDTMKNIYSTSVCESTIDEAPQAYKSLQEIVDNIKDTIDIIKIIKPIYNFKAKETKMII